VVVIGGLVSSTALTLILVPVLYHLIEGAKERSAERRRNGHSVSGKRANTPAVAKATEPTRELIAAMASAGRTPPAGGASSGAGNQGNGAVPPPVSATGATSGDTLINPATGMIPLTRKERKEVESELKHRP
jgi:HAE1 family hydrophobic/amphiphilic exporter-1